MCVEACFGVRRSAINKVGRQLRVELGERVCSFAARVFRSRYTCAMYADASHHQHMMYAAPEELLHPAALSVPAKLQLVLPFSLQVHVLTSVCALQATALLFKGAFIHAPLLFRAA